MNNMGANELAAISRLFASSVIREMARKGRSPLFARLASESRLLPSLSLSQRVSGVFEAAFSLLKREGYRHEYIYKAALTHRILLGTHSLQTASMLHEFRVGDCKADLAILNGTATVYEVKSERDSLSRLDRQLEAYAKVFAKIYVIVGENHVESVMRSVPGGVGVLRLNNRQQISTLRDAADCPERTCPEAIFDSIRTNEAQSILLAQGIKIPDVPNTAMSRALRKLFLQLDPRQAHEAMVATLKRTRDLAPLSQLISQLPPSLQPAALSVPLRKLDHERLVAAVHTPLRDAMTWA
ncbi:MAG: sce7726 family protein [Bryobacterales bacterium]|nr:sce7726 family protein [Bryobacterales bacterium]